MHLLSKVPEPARRALGVSLKLAATVFVFWLLLRHEIRTPDGARVVIWRAIRDNLGAVDAGTLAPLLALAALVKMAAIFASMLRWQLLLAGQGIRFDLWHVVGSFLIGRFLGTFLPSTVGLDAYKLYDASRFSGRVVEPAAATAVEKVMGLSGVFLAFLVTLPFGYRVLGARAGTVAAVTVPVALAVVAGLFLLLFRPGLIEALLRLLPAFGRRRVEGFVSRVSRAAAAYRGKAGLLATVIALSFFVHFGTAAMYWFTARAVGATGATFFEVAFASTIQIFATVMSPFTIAGEGVRELVQALLLAERIGAGASVLSGALGFWAAEALTLFGGVFLWARPRDYRPRRCDVTPTEDGAPAGAVRAVPAG